MMAASISLTPEDNLQKSLDSAPEGSTIRLQPGVYRQKFVIRTPNLSIEGSGAEKSILIWDDYANKTHADGQAFNTFRTYTAAICADGVSMQDLSIVNDALDPKEKGQEVALSVLGDHFSMTRCRLSSTQDTLFAGPLPPDLIDRYCGFLPDELRIPGPCHQHYSECLIEGSVDFIFGCADAVFDQCEIRSVYDGRGIGYVAAPAHSPHQTRGLHFRKCRFTCDSDVRTGSIYLARPWRDYGIAVFEDCQYGPHIAAEGFDKWNDTHRDKTARFYESPSIDGRVSWVRTL